jgi:trk system potassium uptake protein TrkA
VTARRVAFANVHVVIMGCGRVGSALAHTLDQAGHSVAVIDQMAASLAKLHPDFSGITVTGIGFDRDTLIKAGIERAHAFAAVSSGDNSNILAARVARETFGVENVVARIYDPRRAEVYQRLGIPTVASVAWQTDQILRRILPESVGDEWRDGSGKVALTQLPVAESWVGHRISRLEKESGVRVAFLTRYGEGVLPVGDTVVQADDIVHVLIDPSRREAAAAVLANGPEAH